MEKTIECAGTRMRFLQEYDDVDLAQSWLDYWRNKGVKACCLHENGKEQLYVEA